MSHPTLSQTNQTSCQPEHVPVDVSHGRLDSVFLCMCMHPCVICSDFIVFYNILPRDKCRPLWHFKINCCESVQKQLLVEVSCVNSRLHATLSSRANVATCDRWCCTQHFQRKQTIIIIIIHAHHHPVNISAADVCINKQNFGHTLFWTILSWSCSSVDLFLHPPLSFHSIPLGPFPAL